MKILYLHQYFNTPDMSGGTRSYEMAKRLVSYGHQVHMITSWRDREQKQSKLEIIDGINVHWINVPYSNHMSFIRRIYSFIKFALLSTVKALKIKSDIIFATSTPLTIAIPGVISSKLNKIPMVFEVRDLWPELPIAMGALANPVTKYLACKLELFAYNNSSAIVALSPGMKAGVEHTGYPANKIAVIPNSCDINFFETKNCDPEGFRSRRPLLGDAPFLIYTGTLGLINGVSYLVHLSKELKDIESSLKILVIGDGYEREIILNLATELGVLDNYFFLEKNLPKNAIPDAISASTLASSVFIDKPEMRANSANKFFDCLAASKPIMINYGGWQKGIVEKYDCGLVTWQEPINKSALRLDVFINSPEMIKSASASSENLAKKYFDRDVLALQLNDVLLSVLAKNNRDLNTIAPGEY